MPKCSMGLEYLPTFTIDLIVVNVGKYSSPMEHLGCMKHCKKSDMNTLPETNSSPQKKSILNRKIVFQPSICTGSVGFREDTISTGAGSLPKYL